MRVTTPPTLDEHDEDVLLIKDEYAQAAQVAGAQARSAA